METLDHDACYHIFQARDARFDGRIFVGVTSTGIYCRPVCPATSPKSSNCRFYPSAAAAQEAGFRPCLRCRPELAPDSAAWRGGSELVSRGLALIASEAEQPESWTTRALAQALDVSERQLRRVFASQLGASPAGVLKTQRVLRAKQLIHDSRLTMAQIAFAASFGSVRQFNETFQRLYGRTPGSLRRSQAPEPAGDGASPGGIEIRLRYRPPYDWQAMLSSLSQNLIPEVEQIAGGVYTRTLLHGGAAGRIELRHAPAKGGLIATIWHPDIRMLPGIVTRVRRMFDLDSDPATIGAHLARDPMLAPIVKAYPGLRIVGSWDGFETAIRFVLTWNTPWEVDQSRRRELAAIGDRFSAVTEFTSGELSRLFPTPARIANADFSAFPDLKPCGAVLRAVATAALSDPSLFETIHHPTDRAWRLQQVPELGGELGHRIAGAIDGEPDRFDFPGLPRLQRAPEVVSGIGAKPEPVALEERAPTWRPWRAYALNYAAIAQTGD